MLPIWQLVLRVCFCFLESSHRHKKVFPQHASCVLFSSQRSASMASAAETFLLKVGKTDFNDEASLKSLAKSYDYVKEKLEANPSLHTAILSQCRMPQNAAAIAMIMYVQYRFSLCANAQLSKLEHYRCDRPTRQRALFLQGFASKQPPHRPWRVPNHCYQVIFGSS